MHHGLFPNDPEPPRKVRVRVSVSDSSHTTVSTVEDPCEHWTFLTSRLPKIWAAGTEVTIIFTPMELDYLQGKRELDP